VICFERDRADTMVGKDLLASTDGILRLSLPQIPPGGGLTRFDRSPGAGRVQGDTMLRHRFFQGTCVDGYRTSLIPDVRLKRTIGRSQYNSARN